MRKSKPSWQHCVKPTTVQRAVKTSCSPPSRHSNIAKHVFKLADVSRVTKALKGLKELEFTKVVFRVFCWKYWNGIEIRPFVKNVFSFVEYVLITVFHYFIDDMSIGFVFLSRVHEVSIKLLECMCFLIFLIFPVTNSVNMFTSL